jgi:hypothetical protein
MHVARAGQVAADLQLLARALVQMGSGDFGVRPATGLEHIGGADEVARRAQRRAGAGRPVAGAGEKIRRTCTQFRDVRIGRDGLERVDQMPGDDLGNLFTAATEHAGEPRDDGEMSCLALAAGQGVIGDLAQQRLHETEVPTFG